LIGFVSEDNREQIEEYNRTLEARIQERTLEIRNLLNNTDEGIFSITPAGTIQPGWSSATQRMLGPIGPDTNFLAKLTPNPAVQQTIRSTFEMLSDSGILLDWDDMTRFIPKEFNPLPDPSIPAEFQPSADSWLRARFLPLYATDGNRIEDIMVILQDITEEKALREATNRSRSWQETVVQVLQNRETYDQFVRDARELIQQARDTITGAGIPTHDSINSVFRAIHTIKGTAGLFGLGGLAQLAHAAEDCLQALRADPSTGISEARRHEILSRMDSVQQSLDDHDKKMLELLGIVRGEPTVAVPETKLAWVEQDVLKYVPANSRARVRSALSALRRIPVARLLRKYASLVELTGTKLGKSVKFVIEDPDQVEVSMDYFKRLDPAFLHLVRNSLDHGVEAPEERDRLGKDSMAQIKLSCRIVDGRIQFQVSDDGRGINVDRVRDSAIAKGLLTVDSARNTAPADIVRLIFAPGFSSADTVSDLSGRGVGLDMVKATADSLRGKVRVATRRGRGTTFTLSFPAPHEHRLAG
jgi:two-component system chemotaxis sensor kinase CheA